MKGMRQGVKFRKSVSDNGWGMFITMLKYKTELTGKQLIKIDKFYLTNKTFFREFYLSTVFKK